MSKLFELYVLGLLKERFVNDVKYQYRSFWNELDFLLNEKQNGGYKMVIGTKYKPIYQNEDKKDWDIENIRQISGYARLETVYKELFGLFDENNPQTIDCLIIYPEAVSHINEVINTLPHDLKADKISSFVKFYKVGVKSPILKTELYF